MTSTSLTSIPGLQAALDAIDAGSVNGQLDKDGNVRGSYPDLPLTQEFRVVIDSAEYHKANSGNFGIRYVLQITDDGGQNLYVGSKIWGSVYFTGHEFQGVQYGILLRSNNVQQVGTVEESIPLLVGGKLVVALQESLGQDGSVTQYPSPRWLNLDNGQKLNLNVKPKPSKAGHSPAGSLGAEDVAAAIAARAAAQAPNPVVSAPPAEAAPAPVVAQPITIPEAQAPIPANAPANTGVRLPGT